MREEDKTKLNNKIIIKDKEILQLVKLKNVFTTLGYYDNGQVKQLKIVKETVAEQLVQVEAELHSSRYLPLTILCLYCFIEKNYRNYNNY